MREHLAASLLMYTETDALGRSGPKCSRARATAIDCSSLICLDFISGVHDPNDHTSPENRLINVAPKPHLIEEKEGLAFVIRATSEF